jgi:hypothetical protein
VIDDDAHILDPGQEGHLAVRVRPQRPVGMFTGYWRDPAATAAAFRGDCYDTGDRADADQDGYCWFVGRADDVITSAAYRIGPSRSSRPWSSTRRWPRRQWSASPTRCGPARQGLRRARPGQQGSDALVAELQEHCRTVTAPTSTRARSSSPTSCPRPSRARSAASNSASGNSTAAAEHPRQPGPADVRTSQTQRRRRRRTPEVVASASSRAVTTSVLASVICSQRRSEPGRDRELAGGAEGFEPLAACMPCHFQPLTPPSPTRPGTASPLADGRRRPAS